MPEEKEFIYIMPPEYHFKRAVLFTVAARVLEDNGYAATEMKTHAIYEIARGFEALVYQSCVRPA